MGRRRMIHHQQDVSALLESGDAPSPHIADEDALSFPPGTFVLVYRSRLKFKEQVHALADVKRQYPTGRVGRLRLSQRYWAWELQLPPDVPRPTREQPTEAHVTRIPPVASVGGGQAWCAKCANPVEVKGERL